MGQNRVSYTAILRWTDDHCRAYLEKIRWPNGPVCPKCGVSEPYRITRRSRSKNKVRSLYKCRSCMRQFTVTVGTIFEGSKIPLRKWFAAIYPMCAFKRGISAYQINIQAHITYKSSWFMCNKIREILKEERNSL